MHGDSRSSAPGGNTSSYVEEAELVGVLGEPYRAYEAETKRLIPGVW